MQTKSASALFCLWLATALLWGCSSGGGSAGLAPSTVSGVVTGAHSQSASLDSEGLLSRVASLVMPSVRADIIGLTPVAGATVQLVKLNSAGSVVQTIATATTDSNGVYSFANTPAVTDSSLAIQAQDPSENGILMRAIVTGPIVNVSPATEAVTAELISRPGGLGTFGVGEVAALYSLIQGMDVDVSGLDFQTAVDTIRSQTSGDSPLAQLIDNFQNAGTSTVLRNNLYSLIDFSGALRDGVVLNNGTKSGLQLESGQGAVLFGSNDDLPVPGPGISYGVFDHDLTAVTFERGAGEDEATEPLPAALPLDSIMHVANARGQLVTADTTNDTVAGGIGALTSDGSLFIYPTQIISRFTGALGLLEAGIRFGARAFVPNGQQGGTPPLTVLDAAGEGTHYHQVGLRESLSGEDSGSNAISLTTLIGETVYDSTGNDKTYDDGVKRTYGSFTSNNLSTDKLSLNIDSRNVTATSGSEIQDGFYYIFPTSGLVQLRAGDGSLLGAASTPIDGLRDGEVIGSHIFSNAFASPMLEADRTFSVAIRQATTIPVVSGTYNLVEYGGYLSGDQTADPPTAGSLESAIRYGTLSLSGTTAGSSSLYQTRTGLAIEAAAPAPIPNASGPSGVFTTAVADAAGQIFTLGVGGINVFSLPHTVSDPPVAAGDQVTADDIQNSITAHAEDFANAGITVSGTVAEGNLTFTRADGGAFEIAVNDTFGTAGGFAGADFTVGAHIINNGSTVAPSASLVRASEQQRADGVFTVNADGQMTLNLSIITGTGTEIVTGSGAVTQRGDFAAFVISSSVGTRQGRGILFLVHQ